MRSITLYLTLLITSTITSNLLAQNQHVKNIDWTITNQIPAAHEENTSYGLAGAISGTNNNVFLIAGGTNFPGKMPWDGGKKQYYNDVFLYEKTDHKLNLVITKTKLELPFNLAYSAATSTAHGFIIAGGENENGLSKKVFSLNWDGSKLLLNSLPDLPNALTNGALTAIGDIVYLAGGEMDKEVSNQLFSLNLKQPEEGWIELTKLPNQVSHTVLLHNNFNNGDEIFLIGGRKRNPGDTSTIYKDVFAYNVANQKWTAKESLPYQLAAASGISTDNDLLIFSGDKGETFHQAETLIAAMDREKDSEKKAVLNQQKIAVQSNHPGFCKSVLKYDLKANQWIKLKTKLPYGTVTTNSVMFGNEIVIAGGEIKAGVRTPNIMVGKIKTSK